MNKFCEIASHKSNMQKSTVFLYTSNEQSENKIKKTILFIVASKIIKYSGINLTKEV